MKEQGYRPSAFSFEEFGTSDEMQNTSREKVLDRCTKHCTEHVNLWFLTSWFTLSGKKLLIPDEQYLSLVVRVEQSKYSIPQCL